MVRVWSQFFGAACMMMLIAILSVPPAAARAFPSTIALPNGFQPEGVVTGRGPIIYAGSLANGSIYQANLRTGEGELLVQPQEGRVAVGLDFDQRTNYLFVAGGPTGQAYIYDADDGSTVAVIQLSAEGSFINDVIVTRTAAYFTDSFQAVIYRVALAAGGRVPASPTVTELPLSGDFEFVPGAFNANGIVATPDGRSLIVVNSTQGVLYRVDPATGRATAIDLGGASVQTGDGLLLQGRTLYVVRNRLNQIAVIKLAPNLLSGEVTGTITSRRFDVPTTIARFGSSLYAVNARFGTGPTPDTTYTIERVSRKAGR